MHGTYSLQRLSFSREKRKVLGNFQVTENARSQELTGATKTPTRALLWIRWGAYTAPRPPASFGNDLRSLHMLPLFDKGSHYASPTHPILAALLHPSLFRGCYHEIIFGKVAVTIPHPPPYKRRMWDYKVADVLSIRESLMNIDWYLEFGDLVMVDKFTEIILSIIAENIPNLVITVNEKDPPWKTKEIKTVIRRKHRIYNKYMNRRSKQEDWGTSEDYKESNNSSY